MGNTQRSAIAMHAAVYTNALPIATIITCFSVIEMSGIHDFACTIAQTTKRVPMKVWRIQKT